MKQTTSKPRRGRKLLLIVGGMAAVLVLGAVLLLVILLSRLEGGKKQAIPLEDYLAVNWTVFRLRSWEAETGTLELDYPLRFSYEQLRKHGASIEELQDIPTGNLSTVESLKTAAFETADIRIRSVTVYGISSDGQTAYTVRPDGSIEACWDDQGP